MFLIGLLYGREKPGKGLIPLTSMLSHKERGGCPSQNDLELALARRLRRQVASVHMSHRDLPYLAHRIGLTLPGTDQLDSDEPSFCGTRATEILSQGFFVLGWTAG